MAREADAAEGQFDPAAGPVVVDEDLARLGAVACSILVGTWFALALNPSGPLESKPPQTVAELKTLLDKKEAVPLSFPAGFSTVTDEERRDLFVRTMTAVALDANKAVEKDRRRLVRIAKAGKARGRFTLREDAEVNAIASHSLAL